MQAHTTIDTVSGVICVTCNWRPRPIAYGHELPADARAQFDYLTDDELSWRQFVQYRGEWFDLGDVERATGNIAEAGWDGFNSDSYWSGLAFKYVDSSGLRGDDPITLNDYVIVARLSW